MIRRVMTVSWDHSSSVSHTSILSAALAAMTCIASAELSDCHCTAAAAATALPRALGSGCYRGINNPLSTAIAACELFRCREFCFSSFRRPDGDLNR